jgi:hypothetical protein
LLPFNVAVITAFTGEISENVVMVNVALVAPPVTITVGLTVAAEVFPLDRATVTPAAGAGLLNVTVPVELALPPITLVGLRETETTEEGITVSVAATVTVL